MFVTLTGAIFSYTEIPLHIILLPPFYQMASVGLKKRSNTCNVMDGKLVINTRNMCLTYKDQIPIKRDGLRE